MKYFWIAFVIFFIMPGALFGAGVYSGMDNTNLERDGNYE